MEPVSNGPPRHVVLFGATGNLGGAIARALSTETSAVHSVGWRDRSSWLEREAPRLMRDVTSEGGSLEFVFAGGLTDPKVGERVLVSANYDLPMEVVDRIDSLRTKVAPAPNVRFLTFGTVLELFGDAFSTNPYVKSKMLLAAALGRRPVSEFGRDAFHLRLHTLYGGRPKPHLFLGLLADAVQDRRPFRMSAGWQLREYHRIDDIARCIPPLLERRWDDPMPVALGTGRPRTLREIAAGVLMKLDATDLLEVSALPVGDAEAAVHAVPRAPDWMCLEERDAVAGIADWLVELGIAPAGTDARNA